MATRHDILPYEVTLIAYTEDGVDRSNNTYLDNHE